MKNCNVLLLLISFALSLMSCENTKYYSVSHDRKYIQTPQGNPLFINACTAWTLPIDYTQEEIEEYLDNRVCSGFNTIQISAIFSEIDKNRYEEAFYHNDITQPNEDYWEKVFFCVEEATSRGLVVILNPIWKRSVNEFIKSQGVEKCREYGRWFAGHFVDNPQVFYFIGGDQIPEPVRDEMDAMGMGIQDVYKGKAIIAYHSCGSESSREAFPDAEWLTLNWTYAYTPTYKFEGKPRYPYQMNYENLQKYNNIPIQFGEGYYDFGNAKKYEQKGVSGRWGNRYILRRQAWWNATSGASGVAYGAEGIWHKNRDGEHWKKCIEYESSEDMGRMKRFFDSIKWWILTPDINHEVLIDGYGEYLSDNFATAMVAEDKSFSLIYTPMQSTLKIKIPHSAIHWSAKMRWYDPTDETYHVVDNYTLEGNNLTVVSPQINSAHEQDWVLVLGI